jgi:pimeloyl-ACP methyl ester carboxylesterase
MRPLEIVISTLLAGFLLWPHPQPLIVQLAPAIALIIILVHFTLEGYRWQMIPLYALTLILSVLSIFISEVKPPASTLILVLVAVSIALPILLPIPKIPQPSGTYEVGTTSYEFADFARKELYSGKDEPRRFMVQVWYPAEITSTAKYGPWVSEAKIYTRAISNYLELPFFFLDHLSLSISPAYLNVPLAKTSKKYPMILFSHGWGGFSAQNTAQAVKLASRGYVVIGMQHTYGAIVTVFPDGTVALNNPKALPRNPDDPNSNEVVARKLVDQWSGDMAFVLDQFQVFDNEVDNLFFQKLDMERIGVYGHSTGGGAAIQLCGIDPRCKAVLGMDPFMWPVSAEVIENGFLQPSFFMFSQGWSDLVDSHNNKLFDQFYPNIKNNEGVISINGTKHFDFTDVPLLSPIAPQLGLKGPLNGKRVTQIVDAYLLDFFEMTLNNKPSTLFGGSFDDFSEVKVR